MKDTVIILPCADERLKESFAINYKNIIVLNNDIDFNYIVNYINTKNIKTAIFVNFDELYRKVFLLIDKNCVIKSIFTHSIANLTDPCILSIFNNIMEFYDRGLILKIGCTDENLIKLLSLKSYNCGQILLDNNAKVSNDQKSLSVGIISKDYNPNHNFYNALCAAKFANIDNIKIEKHVFETGRFPSVFDINVEYVETETETMANNIVNLFPFFTGNDNIFVLKSFDSGIPCLIGNSNIFKNYSLLSKYCVLESDDDITEMKDKIVQIIANKKNIMEEYKKFKKDYSKKSKEYFLNF